MPRSAPHPVQGIVVGASAGAFDALSRLLGQLSRNFKTPIAIVVHMQPDKESLLPDLLQGRCALQLREACDKEPIEPSTVYFAPPNYHLLIEKDGRFSLSVDEPVLFSRPSIDVLFETAADAYGPRLVGVVLTGANEDGARGLRAIIDAGGIGLVQSPSEAQATAMPKAALKACPEAYELSLEQIASFLQGSDAL